MRKYSEACLAEGIIFTPVAMEVLGGMNEASINIIRKLGRSLARAGGQDEGEVTKHLFGRLSILLQRGNCSLILSRTLTHPLPYVDGNL